MTDERSFCKICDAFFEQQVFIIVRAGQAEGLLITAIFGKNVTCKQIQEDNMLS